MDLNTAQTSNALKGPRGADDHSSVRCACYRRYESRRREYLICRLHGLLKFQRALSVLGSNFSSVGVLWPKAVRAMGSLGMMRYVPSVN